ncbi:transcription elongation factor Elf1 like-domain-containing protein [Cokeromyces recurvatus]|uniref:transcription elongation factor Elf1 like-domain-containing protein n=1 Tax=Cokeromyces recurvatus TaxID=90255 RepID=UPI0022205C13|nr:transcription elongation factor Elf1 like-domain-containing protein [Cokeromyces recurvatus]KAI7897527.1 transcription elongation factor Elf1 like-domain-containing protein [Cokeromyces recurvatus]
MGKRKTKRKPQKKLKEKLDTQFNCLFCNHENSIECKIDHQNKVGILSCKICGVSWQDTITYLDEPIDVYSAWIDACEELNKQRKVRAQQQRMETTNSQRSPPPRSNVHSEDHLDPFDDDDEEDY